MSIFQTSAKYAAVLATLSMAASPALARKASDERDLVGARGSSGESALEQRGYTFITGHAGGDRKYTYYWHGESKHCIQVTTYDGRYSDISDVANSDCNQKSGSNTGAVVAGAAVGAVLLGALLSHKSRHHDDGKHSADTAYEQQYERGYNDGLHNVSYHNYDKTDAYAQGYSAGVQQRQDNTAYHPRKGGYTQSVYVGDLKGWDAIRAIDAMSERGFTNVDSFSSGKTLYGIYWNARTRQCVQMTNADGRVYDIREIGQHPKCR